MQQGLPPVSNRPCHTGLRPVATGRTGNSRLGTPSRWHKPTSASPTSSKSATSHTSPTMGTVVRQYYDRNSPKTAPLRNPSQKNHVVHSAQILPRRHSLLTPGSVATRMGSFAMSSRGSDPPLVHSHKRLSIAEESRETLLRGVEGTELARLGGIVARRKSLPRPRMGSKFSERTPIEHTRNRLREWSLAYLGNVVTADVFVRAVNLRRAGQVTLSIKGSPSDQQIETDGKPIGAKEYIRPKSDKTDITVRARVLPRAKERKPFLLQRHFNLDEMQPTPGSKANSRPVISNASTEEDTSHAKEVEVRSAQRELHCTPSPQHIQRSVPLESAKISSTLSSPTQVIGRVDRRVMPIRKYSSRTCPSEVSILPQ